VAPPAATGCRRIGRRALFHHRRDPDLAEEVHNKGGKDEGLRFGSKHSPSSWTIKKVTRYQALLFYWGRKHGHSGRNGTEVQYCPEVTFVLDVFCLNEVLRKPWTTVHACKAQLRPCGRTRRRRTISEAHNIEEDKCRCLWTGCGQYFAFPKEYQAHEGVHTGVFPFTCPACGKGYGKGSHARRLLCYTSRAGARALTERDGFTEPHSASGGMTSPPTGARLGFLLRSKRGKNPNCARTAEWNPAAHLTGHLSHHHAVQWPMSCLNAHIHGALVSYSLESMTSFFHTQPELVLKLLHPIGCDTPEAKRVMRIPLFMQIFNSYFLSSFLWIMGHAHMAHIALYQDTIHSNTSRVLGALVWAWEGMCQTPAPIRG
jgi:hypothetical protein